MPDLGNAYYDVIVNRSTTFNKAYNPSGKKPLTYMELVQLFLVLEEKHNRKIPLWFQYWRRFTMLLIMPLYRLSRCLDAGR